MRGYLFLCITALLLTTSCVHYVDNSHLDRYVKESGYRFENVARGENSDSLFVILSFSGGGTRAAALSYGVLDELKHAPIRWEGKDKMLIDEVDVISSVSGGSFTAAYYALFGNEIFTSFKWDFLYHNVQGDLIARMFNPYNWSRLMSSTFDRIDMAAEYYDERIFKDKHLTYGDLLKRKSRPYIILNATDMALGDRFEFTQKQFDIICSDLSVYPIARAVAASSAFPGLLSPITITNYGGTCNYPKQEWVDTALKNRRVTDRSFLDAIHIESYQDSARRKYIHLMDGGISDNLGLRGPLSALNSDYGSWDLRKMINEEKIKRLVFIVVNAKNQPDSSLDMEESQPNLKQVISTLGNAPKDNLSFVTIEQLNTSIEAWKKDDLANSKCIDIIKKNCFGISLPPLKMTVEFYRIIISFDSLANQNERAYFKNLPTTFALPHEDIDRLIEVGGRLLNESSEYKRLIQDLKRCP